MKKQLIKQTNLNIAFSAILFAIALTISATGIKAQDDDETPYKVGDIKAGDRVEADPTSSKKWSKCTVIKVNLTYNGGIANYSIRCDTAPYSSVMAYSGHVHLLKDEIKDTPKDAVKDEKGQNDTAQTNDKADPNKKVNKYGTRDPQTCDDTKAPARGAITAALAKKYFICQEEGVTRTDMNLRENVKVEVGAGRPYNAARDALYSDIDVKSPIYPIRGSFTAYQCSVTDTSERWYNIGKNCNAYDNKKAEGSCWRTTFGDWKCHMNDAMKSEDDKHFKVPPPK